jgi:hypothetical protein
MTLPATSTHLQSASLGMLATGFWVSRAIYVAAKIGIADLLAQGPQCIGILAEKSGSDPNALFRLMRALSAIGVFTIRDDRIFELTKLGQALRSDSEGSMRNYVMMLGRPESWRAWEHLEHSIMTGLPAFECEYQISLFQYMAANPSLAKIFDEGMLSRGVADDSAIAAAYDFSEARSLVDLGGGAGRLLTTMMKTAPHAHGILFDLPHVIEGSRNSLAASNVGKRIDFVAGNFFHSVPVGADLYLLKQVIHDWTDKQAVELLSTCRRAMTANSKMLIFEVIVDPDSLFPKLLDLMMMVWTGGLERTIMQYEQLLARAGLRLIRVIPTRTAICILEAVPSI